jgi:hypothetical protein
MPTDVYGNPRVQTPAKEAPSWNEFMADAQGRIATQFGEGDFKNESVEIHYTDDGFSLISLQLSGNAGRIKIDPNDSNSHSYSEPDVYYTEDGGKPLEKAVKVGQDEGAIDYAADPQESASRSSVAHGLAVTLLNELLP